MTCEWCGAEHKVGSATARRHRRYQRTRLNGGIAPATVVNHGASTYNNWHCRCRICVMGNRNHARLNKAKARDRAALVVSNVSTD